MSGEGMMKGLVIPQQRGMMSATRWAQAGHQLHHAPCHKHHGARDIHSYTKLVAFAALADRCLQTAAMALGKPWDGGEMGLRGRSSVNTTCILWSLSGGK